MRKKKSVTAKDAREEAADSAGAEKPVSLHPLDFKEALKGLLRVKPDGDSQSKRRHR